MLRRWGVFAVLVVLVGVMAGCSSAKKASASNAKTAVALEFVRCTADGKYADAVTHFDDAMSRAMSADQLKQAWESLIGRYGAFKKIGETRTGQEGGFDEVFVAVNFEKIILDVKVVFDKDGKIGGLWFVPHISKTGAQYSPPAYAHNDRFVEREVTVGKGEWQLPGTLTIPNGKGPFTALVLVHGSGPENRDETIGPNKPFRDIAQGLASRGIAVLRYDKRTKVYPAQLAKFAATNKFTVKEETIDDAIAAVSLLRKTKEINSDRIYVLGHSLGGILIPRIGKADPKIYGLIMMAGCGTQPLEDVILRQLTYIASLNGPITADTKKEINKEVQSFIKSAPAPYLLDLRRYIPAAVEMAKSLKQPMLILQGRRDYQATTADFNIWKTKLSSRTDVTFKLYPDLNHLFITGKGKITPQEYEVPGHVSEKVVDDIAAWIKR
ncbi:MAG: DUF3887 domain-containing protein [Armatimonadota bacterium]